MRTEAKTRKDLRTAREGATLQHRHFAVIADIIKTLHSLPSNSDRTWVADYFAEQLAVTNPKFDRTRFLKAADAEDRI